MHYFPVMFDVDVTGKLTFNPNGLPINKDKLWKAKDELERFLRETNDSQLYLYNLEAEKQFPPRV